MTTKTILACLLVQCPITRYLGSASSQANRKSSMQVYWRWTVYSCPSCASCNQTPHSCRRRRVGVEPPFIHQPPNLDPCKVSRSGLPSNLSSLICLLCTRKIKVLKNSRTLKTKFRITYSPTLPFQFILPSSSFFLPPLHIPCSV